MLALYLFGLAVLFTLVHYAWKRGSFAETFLAYLLFFNVGLMGLLAGYAHIFMGPEIAEQIGWAPGSPFQFEMGIANISYGVLGVLSFWRRGKFWEATVIGYSILLLGAMVGHIIEWTKGDSAPLNIGPAIWLWDFVLPLLLLGLLFYWRKGKLKG
ncbi:MAG: hypothetical protein KDK48_06765 [Chlamydiia bacterium]|nr:hypothetical protein [Chlamydiia bacterium]